ncbi:glyoxylase-like metal-dependent hydrolase (beta-lactamase superfamily II) [Haloactinomyces albus]|uniref:Glyoxylase-like metal-dependent hydrolase (Beta-lactamase superfamily II) n=1 Tax=Haloactinomyces albus TaxID=1352928 RepID=A0AAE3ZEW3_9ACTN|nr:MBL fold metallo-hydrolase [Haloactinomyces albus]MDR7301739.1 glyoxylase-like metal-dependent hydrolase (beta-lactamase superfamily II) [Haloactinomyces albus]
MSSLSPEHPAYATLRQVTPYASVLLADNPTPMTLDGTNTWIVRAPGKRECVVIDPGPGDGEHLRRVADHGPVELVLLTHHHPDHVEGVQEFVELTGAVVRAFDPALCIGAEALEGGEVLSVAGLRLRVLATPGHTGDSVCFVVEHEDVPALFAGDSILGRGTTVVADPDGHLGSYLDSLRRLAELPEGTRVLPGHGPELPDARAAASTYLAHREQRLGQIRQVVRERGPEVTARQVVEVVYADVDRSVWPAAESTVRAQLTHLRELGEL